MFNLNIFRKPDLKVLSVMMIVLGSFAFNAEAMNLFGRSDILLHIVTQCVDPSVENYCSQCISPRPEGHCGVKECNKTTEVWATDDQYLAMRDIKMCGCPAGFVHGLVLPKSVVTGVEDPKKPEGIWQFAWNEALKKIEPDSIALVVNPQSHRSQNQLHVHLLKLSNHARTQLSQNKPSFVENLEHVWVTATRAALAKGLTDFGVIVTRSSKDQFMIVVTDYSPEAAFTQWRCD